MTMVCTRCESILSIHDYYGEGICWSCHEELLEEELQEEESSNLNIDLEPVDEELESDVDLIYNILYSDRGSDDEGN